MEKKNTIAVILPAYNEEATIADTIREFKAVIPEASVVVCNNASNDRTAEIAKAEGAIVLFQGEKGKGAALRKAFHDTEADIYIMADADMTYPAADLKKMIGNVEDGADLVIGDRRTSYMARAASPLKKIGNSMIPLLFSIVHRCPSYDVLSGGRVLSRSFAKAFPFSENGFTTEMEMNAFAVRYGYRIDSVPMEYRERPDGSKSKISALKDGWRIICSIFRFAGSAPKKNSKDHTKEEE